MQKTQNSQRMIWNSHKIAENGSMVKYIVKLVLELQFHLQNPGKQPKKWILQMQLFQINQSEESSDSFSAIPAYFQIMRREFCVFCVEPLQPTQGSWLVPLEPPKSPKRGPF